MMVRCTVLEGPDAGALLQSGSFKRIYGVKIIQITPGAGAMYCGNCLRDNALVEALRRLGHEVLMVPLYLPLTLDEPDQSTNTPIFFSGINVYLEQKSSFFRHAPEWLHRALAARPLLKWASGRTAKTNAAELGELTLSMLRGEEGNQARELEDLIVWLKTQFKPDVIFLSNVLLLGLARRLRKELGSPIVCMLQGEDYFLDGLSEPYPKACWRLLSELTSEVDQFVALSRYFGDLMRERLGLLAERVQVVYNGISLEGYRATEGAHRSGAPTLGYFARMCREKGLDILVEAFIELRRRGRAAGLQLRVGGSCGPADEPFVESVRGKLEAAGLLGESQFYPNLDKGAKQSFLQSLSVFSVPAIYGEAFGLYVLEALAAGVPVVQPRSGAFPELIEATGGGILCAAKDPKALADAIEELLLEPERAQQLGRTGQQAVAEKFSAEAMARNMVRVVDILQEQRSGVPALVGMKEA
jgi:glycosyltransferase involved in cell wall biosynthesis